MNTSLIKQVNLHNIVFLIYLSLRYIAMTFVCMYCLGESESNHMVYKETQLNVSIQLAVSNIYVI